MHIREATPNDSETISQLWWELATEMEQFHPMNELGPKEEAMPELIASNKKLLHESYDNYTAYIAIKDDTAVGYIDLEYQFSGPMIHDKNILIRQLYTKPEYRNNGIGTKLLQKIEQHALENEVDYINVPVEWDNTKAIELYKKQGFEEKQIKLAKKV